MSNKEQYYCWEWEFKSSPAQLWPLAANTNRFDYDIASRLEKFATGEDVILSQTVYADLEVVRFLEDPANQLRVASFQSELKGFGAECFTLWRVKSSQWGVDEGS